MSALGGLSALTAFNDRNLQLEVNEKKLSDLIKKTMSNLKINQAYDAFLLAETKKKVQTSNKLSIKILREF